MQATKVTPTKTRAMKLAVSLALAGGLLLSAVTTVAAGFTAPQFEPLDGGGGGAFARMAPAVPTVESRAGVMRGGRYVGFLPE